MSIAIPILLFIASGSGDVIERASSQEKRAGDDWWALQPVRSVVPPNLETIDGSYAEWTTHPVDRFVLDTLRGNGLRPSPPASPRDLIRRATYDLNGLPPTPEEIHAFIEACTAETGNPDRVGDSAYKDLVDRLLDSPRYGEHWGRHWLDVVRFGESTGFEVNHLIDNAWPYRDYVIRAFNEDKPFDQFAVEQIAADTVAPGNPDTEIAMAFLVAGPLDIVGNQDPAQAAQIRADTVDEIIRATGEAFLGLTVGCARCHDHKFDPITERDYYGWYATFAGVQHGDRIVATDDQRKQHEAKVRPLNARKDEIAKARAAIHDAIVARGESKRAEYDARWHREPIDRRLTTETFEPTRARFVRLVAEGRDSDPRSQSGFRIDEFEAFTFDDRNVAAALSGALAEGLSNAPGDFARAYGAELAIDGKYGARWIAAGSTLTIRFARDEAIRRVVFSSDREAALAIDSGETTFLSEYRIETSLNGETWTVLADSHDRQPVNDAHRHKRYIDAESTQTERDELAALDEQLRAVSRELDAIPPLPLLPVGTLTQPAEPTHIFLGGDPQRKGDVVSPASLSALQYAEYALASEAPEQERRLALARWIVDPRNPLTPRVLVNRIWHYHFGRGLVDTPSDFGFMGGRPSHPELLDWLASELIDPQFENDGDPWQLKRMHRIIMLSNTYRQSSDFRNDAAQRDASSRLLWRFPPRRLSGEEIRDSMLAVAGKLDPRMGGPGFRLYEYLRDNVSTYVPLDAHGPATYRRAVYHQNARASRIDFMTDYDSPDCALPAPRRETTTSPLQALTSMNHSFTIDMAELLAQRLRDGDDPSTQIQRAFEILYGRLPAALEESNAISFVNSHGLNAFCRALFNSNEFIYLN